MAGESLIIGDGNWGVKSDSLLGYAMNSGRFVPRELAFTRATTGTRTNGALLIETTPYNLVSYSEEFDNPAWPKVRSTISANVVNAPNGTLTADKLVEDTTATNTHRTGQTFTFLVGNTYTVSCYAKAAERTQIGLSFNLVPTTTTDGVVFDLSSGTIALQTSGYTGTITSVGDGWYRCTATKTADATSIRADIGICVSNTAIYTGNGTSGIYIWGAQLVEGSSALDYLPTTTRLNIPRIDYSTGTAALLLEPQRTNLSLFSEQFDNAVWTRTTSTVTPNQGIAPNGTMTMDLLTFISGGTFTTQGISVTSGATYTFSVWLASQSGTQTVEIGNINLNSWQAVTITTTPQRFEVTQVASASTRFPGIKATAAYSIFAWGAQLEVGAYPTSYIPTTSASVTRNADTMTRSNIFTEGLITAAGGTWFVEFRNNIVYTGGITQAQLLGLGNDTIGATANNIFLACSSGTRIRVWKQIAGTITTLYVTSTDTSKVAIKWNGTTADIFENGVKVVSATAFTPTALETLRTIATQHPYYINEMALFPTPLTDTECIALTT